MASRTLFDWIANLHSQYFFSHEHYIVGCAYGYNNEDLHLFIKSALNATSAHIILFVDEVFDRLTHAYERVFYIPISEESLTEAHIVVQRLQFYLSVCQVMVPHAQVLLSDVRDVAFIGDPFSPALKHIEVFSEGEVLQRHDFTQKWIRRCFGDDAFDAIAEEQALCMGTIAGRAHDLVRMLRCMNTALKIPRNAVAGAFGADQAALNYVVHMGLVDCTIMDNHNRVSTLGIEPYAGPWAAIVHQFDRRAEDVQCIENATGLRFGGRVKFVGQSRVPKSPVRFIQSLCLRMPELR